MFRQCVDGKFTAAIGKILTKLDIEYNGELSIGTLDLDFIYLIRAYNPEEQRPSNVAA